MNEQLKNRLKSFAWRLGMMLIAVTVDFTAQNIGMFEMSPAITTVLGLVLGEVSKFINSRKV